MGASNGRTQLVKLYELIIKICHRGWSSELFLLTLQAKSYPYGKTTHTDSR